MTAYDLEDNKRRGQKIKLNSTHESIAYRSV